METKEWRFKEDFVFGGNEGPWLNEPDKIQFIDEETGFPCIIRRGGSSALCGYVGVGKDHPYYKKDYGDCDVYVHGGLTYSAFCEGDPEHGICHVTSPGDDDDIWWLGFDCAHSEDLLPRHYPRLWHGEYRDINYVRQECADLAKQLKEIQCNQTSA